MGTEIETRPESALPVPLIEDPQPSGRALTVFARNPQEMSIAQGQLIEWVKRKLIEIEGDQQELQQNFDIALRNGWGYSGIDRQIKKQKKRLAFYEKVKAALDAGYCIVPNFPIDVFAIRTAKREPAKNYAKSEWRTPTTAPQTSESPALGEGRFVSSAGAEEHASKKLPAETGQTVASTLHESWATDFQDVDFPFALAQPAVLEATQRAMADKFFDEIGVSPTRTQARKGDPMVIGRIYAPVTARWQRDAKSLSFVVAWFLRPDRDLSF